MASSHNCIIRLLSSIPSPAAPSHRHSFPPADPLSLAQSVSVSLSCRMDSTTLPRLTFKVIYSHLPALRITSCTTGLLLRKCPPASGSWNVLPRPSSGHWKFSHFASRSLNSFWDDVCAEWEIWIYFILCVEIQFPEYHLLKKLSLTNVYFWQPCQEIECLQPWRFISDPLYFSFDVCVCLYDSSPLFYYYDSVK